MLAAVAQVVLMLALATSPSTWEALPPLPLGLIGARISVHGDTLLLAGGITQVGEMHAAVQRFDLKAQRWLEPIVLPSGRCFHAQVLIGDNQLLLAGGQRGRAPRGLYASAHCHLVDLKTGEVTEPAKLASPAASPTVHTLADGRVVVIGGRHANLFDPATGKWATAIALKHERTDHASVLLADGRIAVIGGVGVTAVEMVDPARGESKVSGTKLPLAIDDLSAVALPDGRVWVLGGQSSGSGDTTDRTWLLDLKTTAAKPVVEGPRLGIEDGVADAQLVFVDEDTAVLLGGESQKRGRDTELRTVRKLDLKAVRVTPLPDMHGTHDDAAAAWVDGAVYIAGGLAYATLPFRDRPVPVASNVFERLPRPDAATD